MPKLKYFETREDYNKWYREYRAKNSEKLREYNRNYQKIYRKKNGYHNEINSHKRYPEKEHSRYLLREAIRKGILKRGNCEVCAKPNAQGHHDDYFKPLEVKWFCPLHHVQYEKSLSTTKAC